MANQRRKFLIDTDAGVDDAQAILMALSQPNIDVVAITSTHGNTTAHQVCKNVLRTLKVADRLDVPVYRGAEKSLVGTQGDSSFYHGKDGLGDVPDPDPVDEALIMSEHAVTAMLSMSKKYKGELTLVAIGPLTNVALAIRLDPEFGKRLKDCYIMGGNYEGKGNITPSAEFNFHTDPEAAQVVLNELGCPITMACWELCLKHSFPWGWYYKTLLGQETARACFIKAVESNIIKTYYSHTNSQYETADQIAMALAIDNEVIQSSVEVTCQVCLGESGSRGQMMVDWRNISFSPLNVTINEHEQLRSQLMTTKNIFLTSIQQQSISGVKRRGRKGRVHCDEIAVALAIDHNILKQGRKTFATVELIGDKTRGQMIIDDRINCTQNENVTIATEIEKELFLKYLKHAAH